ncbi:bolA-like protein 2 isoform 2, partial [Daubentonia madagascariensis]
WNLAPNTSGRSCSGTWRRSTCFRVLVVSAKFEGKPLLQRHRLVNTCLEEELPRIHAF